MVPYIFIDFYGKIFCNVTSIPLCKKIQFSLLKFKEIMLYYINYEIFVYYGCHLRLYDDIMKLTTEVNRRFWK